MPLPQISTTTTTTTTTPYPHSNSATSILATNNNLGYPLYSNTGGYTWNLLTSFGYRTWSSIAQNIGGVTIAAGVNGEGIYVSNDSGSTIPTLATTNDGAYLSYTNIAVSLLGQYIVVQGLGGNTIPIRVSNNYGATFSLEQNFSNASSNLGGCIALSGTGEYMQAWWYNSGASYKSNSTDYGATWDTGPNPYNGRQITDISINYSGQYMTISNKFGSGNGRILTSNNYGVSYIERYYDSVNPINFCAVSSTGEFQFAVSSNGIYYYSKNFGATWTNGGTIGVQVAGLTMSSTGDYVVIFPYNLPYIKVFESTSYETGPQTISLSGSYAWYQISSGSE